MKAWNERRLNWFFRLNFDDKTCKSNIENEILTVTDEIGDKITFILKENKIYSPDTEKYYS